MVPWYCIYLSLKHRRLSINVLSVLEKHHRRQIEKSQSIKQSARRGLNEARDLLGASHRKMGMVHQSRRGRHEHADLAWKRGSDQDIGCIIGVMQVIAHILSERE